jgi:hypothetical protein
LVRSTFGDATIGLLAAVGVLGLALKGRHFSNRKIYKSEKYATIAAYKQKARELKNKNQYNDKTYKDD